MHWKNCVHEISLFEIHKQPVCCLKYKHNQPDRQSQLQVVADAIYLQMLCCKTHLNVYIWPWQTVFGIK